MELEAEPWRAQMTPVGGCTPCPPLGFSFPRLPGVKMELPGIEVELEAELWKAQMTPGLQIFNKMELKMKPGGPSGAPVGGCTPCPPSGATIFVKMELLDSLSWHC